MKIIWTTLLLSVWGISFGQLGFVEVFDTSFQDISEFHDVLIDNDTIVLYSAKFDENNVQGIEFLKMDTFGNILSKALYTNGSEPLLIRRFRKKIIQTVDDGYLIFGTYSGTPYLLKVNHDLSLDFFQEYLSNIESGNGSLVETPNGYLLVGLQGIPGEQKDIFVIKTDKQGNQIWRKVYVWNESDDNAFNIKQLDDNSYVIGATQAQIFDGTQGSWNKSFLFCIDSIGIEKWIWISDDAPTHGPILDFQQLPDSSWICLSGTWELNPNATSYWTRPMIFRMDKNFNMMWDWYYWKLVPFHVLTNLELMPDGNFLASGWVDTYPDYTNQVTKAIHYKFTAEGDSLWMRLDSIYPDSISDSYGARVSGTALLSSGSIISIGTAYRSNPYGSYGFVIKISPDGCIDTLNCWPVTTYMPFVETEKIEIYPNPMDDELTIEIGDSYSKDLFVCFYDVMGRFLRKQRLIQGRNHLYVSDLPIGMGFYAIKNRQQVISRGKLLKN